MGKDASGALSLDERRLIAYALCALVDALEGDQRQILSVDASRVADKLGIAEELVEAIKAHQTAS